MLEGIQIGRWGSEIAEARQVTKGKGKDAYREFKSNRLPAFTASGSFSDRKTLTQHNRHSLGDTELEKDLHTALSHLDAFDRENWIRYGHALKSSPLRNAYDMWHEWSRTGGSNYKGEEDCRKTWDSFKPQRTGIGKIFKDAENEGWKNPRKPLAYGGGTFVEKDTGLWFQPPPKLIRKQLMDQLPVWVCSPMKVKARTRDSISDSWGILLQWKDLDEVTHQ